jgi:hypothetical protein
MTIPTFTISRAQGQAFSLLDERWDDAPDSLAPYGSYLTHLRAVVQGASLRIMA